MNFLSLLTAMWLTKFRKSLQSMQTSPMKCLAYIPSTKSSGSPLFSVPSVWYHLISWRRSGVYPGFPLGVQLLWQSGTCRKLLCRGVSIFLRESSWWVRLGSAFWEPVPFAVWAACSEGKGPVLMMSLSGLTVPRSPEPLAAAFTISSV